MGELGKSRGEGEQGATFIQNRFQRQVYRELKEEKNKTKKLQRKNVLKQIGPPKNPPD